jgi:hypothetical protein
MQTPNLPVREGKGKNWPDFYSILNSSPENDTETLRRSINALYVKANQESDHRELSVRFYNQVLSEKVLPQCRRILLNDVSRQAYDQQWHLHRNGAEDALSYQEFIHQIAQDAGTERALLLSSDEISILPSFSSPGAPAESITESTLTPIVTPVVVPVETPVATPVTEVLKGEVVIEPKNDSPAASSSFVVAPSKTTTAKKGFPIFPALTGLVVLGIGGFLWNASRQSDETPADPQVASLLAKSKEVAPAAAPVAPPAPVEALDHPLIRLNTLALNADFETGRITPWVASNKQAYVESAPLHNAKSGNGIFTFWDTVPYDAKMHQTISGLKPGKYTLRAWTQRTGGQERAEMSVTGYGGPTRIITLPAEPTWTMTNIRDIEVKIDRCTIGFSAKGPAYKHVQIDCVEFFRQ